MGDEERLFKEGCEYFDAGDYFEAHEVWEDLWNELDGPYRSFVQALIQIAVALHHAGNANFNGASKLLATAFNHLENGQSASGPIDAERLKDQILEFESHIRKGVEGKDLPYFRLPYLS